MATGNITSINKIINGETISINNIFLYPNDDIIINGSLSNTNNNNTYGIKIVFNEKNIYQFFDFIASSFSINIKIPNVFTNSSNIQFILIEQTDNAENILSSSDTYTNYVFPTIIEKEEIKIDRCTDDYSLNVYGEKILASKIKWKLISGNIDTINNIIIKVNKSIANFSTVEISLQDDNLLSSQYDYIKEKFFSEEGYNDFSEENKLFASLNNNNIFKEIKYTYDLEFIFLYTDITGEHEISFPQIKLKSSLTSLQLIGKTKLNDGSVIFGGVTIGQNPTINKIGEPAFECGYPAYFNNSLYINGEHYGYYPGDEFIITDIYYSVMGYITNSEKRLAFTFNLGQPIYANSFDVSGKVVRRSDNAYLTSNEYQNGWDMGANNNIAIKTITNRKAGIVTVAWEQAVGTAGSNNHPVVMHCHETSYIKITFK